MGARRRLCRLTALLHFAAWQQEGLRRYAVENVAYMSARNPLSERQQAQAAAFFYAAMNAYWRGTLSKEHAGLSALLPLRGGLCLRLVAAGPDRGGDAGTRGLHAPVRQLKKASKGKKRHFQL